MNIQTGNICNLNETFNEISKKRVKTPRIYLWENKFILNYYGTQGVFFSHCCRDSITTTGIPAFPSKSSIPAVPPGLYFPTIILSLYSHQGIRFLTEITSFEPELQQSHQDIINGGLRFLLRSIWGTSSLNDLNINAFKYNWERTLEEVKRDQNAENKSKGRRNSQPLITRV